MLLPSLFRRFVTAITFLLAVSALAACSSDSQSKPETQYIANNFREIIDEALTRPYLQEFDRAVLERAKEAGRIEQSDYDEAYSRSNNACAPMVNL